MRRPSSSPGPEKSGGAAPRGGPRRGQPEPDAGFVAVGRVIGPHGIKGEVKVEPLSDNPQRFAPGAILRAGGAELRVAARRTVGRLLYVSFDGLRERNAAEALRGALLQVPESDLPPLPPGEHYRFQIVGLRVEDRAGQALGTVAEVLETGANDVYRIATPEGGELLLPALDDVVVEVDIERGLMIVDPPEWR